MTNTKTIYVLMAIFIAAILMSGCVESRHSYKKVNVTNEVHRSGHGDDWIIYPYMWNYPYYYGYYSPVDYASTSSSGRVMVFYPTEDQYVRLPELVEVVEKPGGGIDYEQIGFVAPGTHEGEPEFISLEGDEIDLNQVILEAETSGVTEVSGIPEDQTLPGDQELTNTETNIETSSELSDTALSDSALTE